METTSIVRKVLSEQRSDMRPNTLPIPAIKYRLEQYLKVCQEAGEMEQYELVRAECEAAAQQFGVTADAVFSAVAEQYERDQIKWFKF